MKQEHTNMVADYTAQLRDAEKTLMQHQQAAAVELNQVEMGAMKNQTEAARSIGAMDERLRVAHDERDEALEKVRLRRRLSM